LILLVIYFYFLSLKIYLNYRLKAWPVSESVARPFSLLHNCWGMSLRSQALGWGTERAVQRKPKIRDVPAHAVLKPLAINHTRLY